MAERHRHIPRVDEWLPQRPRLRHDSNGTQRQHGRYRVAGILTEIPQHAERFHQPVVLVQPLAEGLRKPVRRITGRAEVRTTVSHVSTSQKVLATAPGGVPAPAGANDLALDVRQAYHELVARQP